jgi:hypothetical protein
MYSVRTLLRNDGGSRSGVYVDRVSVIVLGRGLERDSRVEWVRGRE